MDLELLYRECAKDQVKNFYKLHTEVFKSLAIDSEDLEQEIKILIWQTLDKTKGLIFDKGIRNYIGGVVSNHLRSYITKATCNEDDIALEHFGIDGMNQTDQEILDNIYRELKDSDKLKDTNVASLHYAIFYKKALYKAKQKNKSLPT